MFRFPKISKYFIMVISITFLFSSCAPTLEMSKNSIPEELGICITYSDEFDEKSISLYNEQLANFIKSYNGGSHPFKLADCVSSESKSLRLEMKSNTLRGPGMQTAGVVVSALGIITFIATISSDAGFYVWWYWLPQNATNSMVSLSNDISEDENNILFKGFSSSPYFGDLEEQKVRQATSFHSFLRQIVDEVEDSVD